MRVFRQLLLVCSFAMAGLGCADGVNGSQGAGMEPVQSMRMQCVGRHQISLPESFRIEHIASSATFYFGHGADFETVEFQLAGESLEIEDFLRTVGGRSAEIAGEINDKTKGSMLLAHEDLGDDTFLLRYHRSDISDRSHVHEVHRLVQGAHVFLKAESFKGAMEPVESRLKALASQARAVPQPMGGFCIGPVAIDAGSDYEMATIRYRDSRASSHDIALKVELDTFSRDEDEPGLVRRLDRNFQGFGFRPKTLRKGAAQVSGMPAEEWLGKERTEQGVEHVFVIESYPSVPGLATPTLRVTLGTGGRVSRRGTSGIPPYSRPASLPAPAGDPLTSSLTDGEAVALWDAIVRSVQPR